MFEKAAPNDCMDWEEPKSIGVPPTSIMKKCNICISMDPENAPDQVNDMLEKMAASRDVIIGIPFF